MAFAYINRTAKPLNYWHKKPEIRAPAPGQNLFIAVVQIYANIKIINGDGTVLYDQKGIPEPAPEALTVIGQPAPNITLVLTDKDGKITGTVNPPKNPEIVDLRAIIKEKQEREREAEARKKANLEKANNRKSEKNKKIMESSIQ